MLGPFGVEDERREDNDAKDEKENEKTELVGTGLERVYKDLEAGRVPRELEQPHDSNDAEKLENLVFFAQPSHYEVDVKR